MFAKAMAVITSDTIYNTLVTYDQNPDPVNYVVNSTEMSRDPARDSRFFQEMQLRFFTFTIN